MLIPIGNKYYLIWQNIIWFDKILFKQSEIEGFQRAPLVTDLNV